MKTDTQGYVSSDNTEETEDSVKKRKAQSVQDKRGLHESFEWYDKCFKRDRNKGIYIKA